MGACNLGNWVARAREREREREGERERERGRERERERAVPTTTGKNMQGSTVHRFALAYQNLRPILDIYLYQVQDPQERRGL